MGFYYNFLYKADWLTLSLPFMISAGIFYLTYTFKYKRLSTRVRTKELVKSYVKPINSPLVARKRMSKSFRMRWNLWT